ncbi:MAG TPA: helicase-related protein, partial [Dehalococcoidia bacterium]|nr:helicase-related protein [Dehalococcoidia bacterium]
VGETLFLIVDECHRAGAPEMRRIFQTKRRYSLGLSATPERDTDEIEELEAEVPSMATETQAASFDDSVVGREMGGIVWEMNYSDAIRLGVLAPFRVVHYGLSLTADERRRYDSLSDEIRDLRRELETPNRRGLRLIRWCRSKAGARDPRARRLIYLTVERKALLFRMEQRYAGVREIIRRALDENPHARVIIFHESIEEVMRFFLALRTEGYSVVAEHSEFPDEIRAGAIRLFRNGVAQIIVSARSLIEGFNVPAADVGIVAAASASVRQRVQTLGRLLRRTLQADGSEKQASLYVLYAASTVDEMIYEKVDWDHFVGAERSEYFLWEQVGVTEPARLEGPPRVPRASDEETDPLLLSPGDTYPGNMEEGAVYVVDTQGTIRDDAGRIVRADSDFREILTTRLPGGGRVRVTPRRHYVVRLERGRDGWRGVYLGKLASKPRAIAAAEEQAVSGGALEAGAIYPLEKIRGRQFSVLLRDQRLIAEKGRGGAKFVLPAASIESPEKRAALEGIQAAIRRAYEMGHRISRITVTPEGHAVYIFGNSGHFLGHAPEGAAGFVMEDAERG